MKLVLQHIKYLVLRKFKKEKHKYHIKEDYSYFKQEDDKNWYRYNQVSRRSIDRLTGNVIEKNVIVTNKAKVLYDSKFIDKKYIKDYLKENL